MQGEYRIKQLTGLYASCKGCGLPVINCLCGVKDRVQTKAKFWILSAGREITRPSNTARILKLINPNSTEIFLWERTKNPVELVKLINEGTHEVFILFPAEDEELRTREVKFRAAGKPPAFILLDGTWKEARRMMRKSSYLQGLPLVSLSPRFKSAFDLRRGAPEGSLCTIEAAVQILLETGEQGEAAIIDDFYRLFLRSYKAGASGHKLKVKHPNY